MSRKAAERLWDRIRPTLGPSGVADFNEALAAVRAEGGQCDGYAGDPGASAPRCESYLGHPGRHFVRPLDEGRRANREVVERIRERIGYTALTTEKYAVVARILDEEAAR